MNLGVYANVRGWLYMFFLLVDAERGEDNTNADMYTKIPVKRLLYQANASNLNYSSYTTLNYHIHDVFAF